MMATGTDNNQTRSGFVAIVGRPNVGKSTLLNAVLGTKLAIVSSRPQTTRNRILGVLTRGPDQLVLLDTPGIHRSRANLNRFMIKEALDALEGVDCIVIVTEVQPRRLAGGGTEADPVVLHPDDRYVLEQVRVHRGASQSGASPKVIIAVNKIDRMKERPALLPLLEAWRAEGFDHIVPISALENDGVDRLLLEVSEQLPPGPHHYSEELFTDRAERFLAAELIREQIFTRCHQELPYAVAVEIESFTERRDRGDVVIVARIHVERDGQKAILIGKRGEMIKTIGTASREQIGRLLGCEVHVKLSVHVESDWTHSPSARRRFGYE